MSEIRKISTDNYAELQKLWTDIFHDDELFVSDFFSLLSGNMEVFAAEQDGLFVGSAYILNTFTYKNGETALPCPYIYAVGVHPEYRGQGIGKALTSACRDFCTEKHGVSCLVPADSKLFEYYKSAGYIPAIYTEENSIEREGAVKAEVTSISAEEYGKLREELLANIPHMEYNESALRFLENLSDRLLLIRSEDSYAIAAYECRDTLFATELLCSDRNTRGFAAALLWYLDAEELTYRTIAKEMHSENAKAFGMLSKAIYDGSIYMGPAFD